MENITLHIEYLLQYHDCVTLPGVGALLVHGEGAQYDAAGSCWRAPRRVVSFNADISRTDGLLARSLARREGITHEAAAKKVDRAMGALRASLEQGNSVHLGQVGTLSHSNSGTLIFSPDRAWSRRAATTMWLPEVAATPVDQSISAARTLSRRSARRATILSAAGRVAACLALVVALAWVVTTNLRTGNNAQYASIVPVASANLIEHPGQVQAPIVWIMRHHDDAAVAVEPKNTPAPAPAITEAPGYYLVVASLANMREADDFMARYPGEHFGVLKADGRYRVYTHTAATAAELYKTAASESHTAKFVSSWVCRR